jgi:hypothetical protein
MALDHADKKELLKRVSQCAGLLQVALCLIVMADGYLKPAEGAQRERSPEWLVLAPDCVEARRRRRLPGSEVSVDGPRLSPCSRAVHGLAGRACAALEMAENAIFGVIERMARALSALPASIN